MKDSWLASMNSIWQRQKQSLRLPALIRVFYFLFLAGRGAFSALRRGPHRGMVVPVHGHLQQVVQVVLQLFLEERKREEEEGRRKRGEAGGGGVNRLPCGWTLVPRGLGRPLLLGEGRASAGPRSWLPSASSACGCSRERAQEVRDAPPRDGAEARNPGVFTF